MNLSFFGAAHEVTGSCSILNACGKTIMIDCGMEQGTDTYENSELPVKASDVDFILLTHAHIDHSGKIPMLISKGFCGKIYATLATTKLCEIMLLDSAHIQESEANWKNRKAKRSGAKAYTPLYTANDVRNSISLFNNCEYDLEYKICDGITIKFIDAGHLLGSSSISITITEKEITKTIVFSGDIGNIDRPLIRDPGQPQKADYVVMESTYGNRVHGKRPDYVKQLTSIIQSTFDKGGNVVIPSFAVGRTQELLYLFRIIKEKNLIINHDHFPVYVDSPLANEATEIYNGDMRQYYDEEALELIDKGINPIKFQDLKPSVSSSDSIKINSDHTPKIIISSSGMCEAGRIRHHLKHNLWREESTILFVGYQSNGTLGKMLLDGEKTVKLFGETINVRARIEHLDGISGHADKNILLSWISGFSIKPDMIFVNHGNDEVCVEFADLLQSEFNIKALAPFNGSKYNLIDGVCIDKGNTIKISSIQKSEGYNFNFSKLQNSGMNLIEIIQSYKNRPSSEVNEFRRVLDEFNCKWKKN